MLVVSWRMVPRNGKKTLGKLCRGMAETHFFILHLFNSSSHSQTSPLSLYDLTALVPMVIMEIFAVLQPATADDSSII